MRILERSGFHMCIAVEPSLCTCQEADERRHRARAVRVHSIGPDAFGYKTSDLRSALPRRAECYYLLFSTQYRFLFLNYIDYSQFSYFICLSIAFGFRFASCMACARPRICCVGILILNQSRLQVAQCGECGATAVLTTSLKSISDHVSVRHYRR